MTTVAPLSGGRGRMSVATAAGSVTRLRMRSDCLLLSPRWLEATLGRKTRSRTPTAAMKRPIAIGGSAAANWLTYPIVRIRPGRSLVVPCRPGASRPSMPTSLRRRNTSAAVEGDAYAGLARIG